MCLKPDNLMHFTFVNLYFRKQVKNITQTTADCTTKLRQLLADAKKLKPGDWVQVLREDNTVRSFLLQSLDRSIQQILNGKAKENADLVNQLVNLAGKETFPSRDDILKKLGTRKLFVCGT